MKTYQKPSFVMARLLSKMSMILLIFCSVSIFLSIFGCSRQRYRQQADCEVSELIGTVGRNKKWELTDYSVQPSPQSRFFDSHNPDCEPMPTDDATAHRYMHYVDGKLNGDWDARGKTNFVENPFWQQYLPMDENGVVRLDKETAFRLAQVHSPEYQTALENLYLSALNVSSERFAFDTQFYGGNSLFYSSNGAVRDSTLRNKNWIGFEKKMATGGQAVIDLANTLTWQLAGPDTQSYNTLLTASFLQPFLRNGGREYVLENLTRSERNLLANVRQMAFYRQSFYRNIVFGGNSVGTPTISGTPNSRSTGSGTNGGYISLLASQVRIANQQRNVVSNRDSEKQITALFEAGRVRQYIQVEQTRASYLQSQSRLITQTNSYNSSVEQFVSAKIGLPPDLKVKIEDPLLQQFEIISPSITAIQDDVEKHFAIVRDKKQPIPDSLLNDLYPSCEKLKIEIQNVYDDVAKLESKIPERIANIHFLTHETKRFDGYIDPASFSEEAFLRRVTSLRQSIPDIEKRLRAISRLIDDLRKIKQEDVTAMLQSGRLTPESTESLLTLGMRNILEATKTQNNEMPTDDDIREQNSTLLSQDNNEIQNDAYRSLLIPILTKLTSDIRNLSLNQAQARLDAITMTPIDVTPETALKVASQHRLDWMNARAELVNKWRDIEIAANQLESDLSFSVDGNIGTTTKNPVDFSRKNASLNVGVQWDAPLDRLVERNAYRKAQIDYQQARRNYYTFVDDVNGTLRETLRNIEEVQFDFEVQRRAVLVAISRVHLAQLSMEEPPAIGQTSETMSNSLARDLVEALNQLLDVQNQFMEIWVNHYGLRSALSLDLGVMQLDDNGVWLDPGSIREADYNSAAENVAGNFNTPYALPDAPTLSPNGGSLGLSNEFPTKNIVPNHGNNGIHENHGNEGNSDIQKNLPLALPQNNFPKPRPFPNDFSNPQQTAPAPALIPDHDLLPQNLNTLPPRREQQTTPQQIRALQTLRAPSRSALENRNMGASQQIPVILIEEPAEHIATDNYNENIAEYAEYEETTNDMPETASGISQIRIRPALHHVPSDTQIQQSYIRSAMTENADSSSNIIPVSASVPPMRIEIQPAESF
ncbi:MAG: hypothetical protein LBJ67_05090 [Planctomycetaceae bacterium]|jgi:hypothetical protein|nr:hypothetical protein [Planctomycetaceae bacterium]